MMGDLLEYFETRNQSLDKAEVSHSLCLDNKFTSAITFNGVPILPPVMTQKRKEEMAGYRRQAVQRETRRRTMQREQLVAKVQSIVSEVEEKRASSRGVSESTCSSPVGSDSAASVRASPAPSFKNSAPESTNTGSGAKSRLQDRGSSQPDTTSKSVHSKRERPETSRSQVSKKVEEKTVSAQKSEAKPNLSENNVKKKSFIKQCETTNN